MQLFFSTARASYVCAWGSFALLRDNVQHYLEAGEPSDRFRALHSLETVVDDGPCEVDASRLRGEVLRAWCTLWNVSVANAAISLRTRAVLTGCVDLPVSRATLLAIRAGWALPIEGRSNTPIPRAAGEFVAIVLALTEAVVDGHSLRVRFVGKRPMQFSSAAAGAR
jgi:hypothetical protein